MSNKKPDCEYAKGGENRAITPSGFASSLAERGRSKRIQTIKARVLAGEYEAQPTLIAQSMWSHVKNWLQKS